MNTALSSAIKSLHDSQGTSTALKVSLINEIVSFYKAHPEATPQHLLADSVSKAFVGRAFGAWYVFKSGIAPEDIAVTFVANNYGDIVAQDTPALMSAELARVSALVSSTKKALADSDAQNGKAYTSAVEALNKGLEKVSASLVIPSPASDALIMAFEAQALKIVADYRAAVKATQQEKTPINA